MGLKRAVRKRGAGVRCRYNPGMMIAAALLLAGAVAGAPLAPLYRVTGPGATPEGGFAVGHAGMKLELREIGPGERFRMLEELVGLSADPFDLVKDGEPFFRTFRLDIDNGSPTEVRFSPGFFIIELSDEHKGPMGYTLLYSFLNAVVHDDKALAGLSRLLAETSVTVPPQTRVTQLLIYDKVPKRREVTLDVSGVVIGSKEISTRIQLERPKIKR